MFSSSKPQARTPTTFVLQPRGWTLNSALCARDTRHILPSPSLQSPVHSASARAPAHRPFCSCGSSAPSLRGWRAGTLQAEVPTPAPGPGATNERGSLPPLQGLGNRKGKWSLILEGDSNALQGAARGFQLRGWQRGPSRLQASADPRRGRHPGRVPSARAPRGPAGPPPCASPRSRPGVRKEGAGRRAPAGLNRAGGTDSQARSESLRARDGPQGPGLAPASPPAHPARPAVLRRLPLCSGRS